MADLLLELFSEEIPARMQRRAAADLSRLMRAALDEAGLSPAATKAFATPRRLTFVATGLPERQPDRREEKKGPRVGAPEKAVEGFLRSAGLSSVEEAEIREDKKGQFYVAVIEETGRPTAEVVAEAVPKIVRSFPWPKSMRWGGLGNDLRWIRPLHRILCTLGGEIVDFTVENGDRPIRSGDVTEGHRFMAPGEIQVRSFEPYEEKLRAAKVVLDPDEREEIIAGEAAALCQAQGLELVPDKGLLSEVAGLAEWPVPRIGAFDSAFLALPDEVLSASMKGHQKYFSVRDPSTGRLAPRFIAVANVEPQDGGASMMTGYERVLTARLSDGLFLYEQDRKTTLAEHAKKLSGVTFFEGLGTIADKVERVAALAREIAPKVGADPDLAEKAARLCKADLVTEMVGEFPELQGVMGRYYALEEGIEEEVADAIRDHYKPAGQGDEVPTAPVSVAVALADKLDTISQFWFFDYKPTSSKDPFGLRRACLGIIDLMLANDVRIDFTDELAITVLYIMKDNEPGFDYRELREVQSPEDESRGIIRNIPTIWDMPYKKLIGYDGLIEHRAKDLSNYFYGHLWLHPEDDAADREAWQRGVDAFTIIKDRIDDLLNVSFNWYFPEEGESLLSQVKNEGYLPISVLMPVNLLKHDLLAFFHDRLTVYLREKGHRHDHVAAVLTPHADDLVLVVKKLQALEDFLGTKEGEDLTAAYKRAANILRAEGKKGGLPEGPADPSRLEAPEERDLHKGLQEAEGALQEALDDEAFSRAMSVLSHLRAPLDAFFETVTVNADDEGLRANRLALLNEIREACDRVADFSKLEG